jgi:outer membrane cobalamin receptor
MVFEPRRIWLIASLVLAAAAAPAAAQETKKVDPVVVTATRVETPAEQLGVSLNVVTEDDF